MSVARHPFMVAGFNLSSCGCCTRCECIAGMGVEEREGLAERGMARCSWGRYGELNVRE